MMLHAGHVHEPIHSIVRDVATSQQPMLAAPRAAPSAPVFNSLPGAQASLYLDFNGHFESVWGSYRNISSPAFDTDGNRSSFNSAEQAIIREIWQRVAEDFAPFRINVTTVAPSSFANGVALRVVIGATPNFLGQAVGGVAYVDSFTNNLANTVYVFPQNLSNNARFIAEASSHEAGHAFGLEHQSRYNSAGRLVDEYNPGTAAKAPIMGNSYNTARSTWWRGPSTSASTIQDDMAILARTQNGFGYRADDVGQTVASSRALTRSGNTLRGAGIVSRTSDQDWWSFTTRGGQVSLNVNVAAVGANLDARIALLRVTSSGTTVVATANPGNSLNASITRNLSAGRYILVVTSAGAYGDVGQYTISGTAPAASTTPAAAPVLVASRTPAIPVATQAVEAVFRTEAVTVERNAAAAVAPAKAVSTGRAYARAVERVMAHQNEWDAVLDGLWVG
jgi:hypothetical protein